MGDSRVAEYAIGLLKYKTQAKHERSLPSHHV
jgi:hypothetical protein